MAWPKQDGSPGMIADQIRRQRPDRDHGLRRQRQRQDDVDRQAGPIASSRKGKNVLLGAGDTFRAAAVEQLTIWSERIGVPIVTGPAGSHPASVAYRAVGRGN